VVDLSTTYMGLQLASPLVVAASPLSRTLDGLRRIEDAGAGAVVLYSLFEEQIDPGSLNPYLAGGVPSVPGINFPAPDEYRADPDEYLEHVRRAKETLGIPVIASLNGVSVGPWTRYARLIGEAGADALELNLYYIPTDVFLPGAAVEQAQVELLQQVAVRVGVPVAVKLGPLYSNVADLARRLTETGARGLVFFNRLVPSEMDVETTFTGSVLSAPGDIPTILLARHWIALLHKRLGTDLAACGGIHRTEDVVHALLAGASVVQVASALMLNGIDYLEFLRTDLQRWCEEHDYASVQAARGARSLDAVRWPAASERARYVRQVGTTHPPGLPWSSIRGDAPPSALGASDGT
jgi:dihydroorotate dehydrogenase (fumarate)